jgi:hypothetical protein
LTLGDASSSSAASLIVRFASDGMRMRVQSIDKEAVVRAESQGGFV